MRTDHCGCAQTVLVHKRIRYCTRRRMIFSLEVSEPIWDRNIFTSTNSPRRTFGSSEYRSEHRVDPENVAKVLQAKLPETVKNFIENARYFGKTKLVLRKGQYYVESHGGDSEHAAQNPKIKHARWRIKTKSLTTTRNKRSFTEMQAARDVTVVETAHE